MAFEQLSSLIEISRTDSLLRLLDSEILKSLEDFERDAQSLQYHDEGTIQEVRRRPVESPRNLDVVFLRGFELDH